MPKLDKKQNGYTAQDIFVLEGLEPVRKRPGMYIGGTGIDGLHHLIWEVFDNSLDEAMGGHANQIDVRLEAGNRITIKDNGRGIPVDKHKQTGVSALETVMTTLHAGGKFGGESYKVSTGLHGVGVSVVNALSSYLRVEVHRDGGAYEQEYVRGVPKKAVKKIDSSKEHGTSVTFEPDPQIFKEINFDWNRVLVRLRQQAYLTKAVRIDVRDERANLPAGRQAHAFYFEGGIVSYVHFLNRHEEAIHPNVFYAGKEHDKMMVEVALQYTNAIQGHELSFANNVHTLEGGSHLTGFRTSITRVLNDYGRKNGFLKEKEENLTGEDMREGLTVVVSVRLQEAQFEGQTKAKLGTPEARGAVETVFGVEFADWLESNPSDARAILGKVTLAAKARIAAKAARDTVIRKGALEGFTLPGKLADCSSKNPEESEIFIVEGESAGGCFSGDMKVALLDGRNLEFRELAKEQAQGKQNYCYTIDADGHVAVAPIRNVRITKKNTEVIKIVLDNGEEIVCTPDHRFMMRDGSYREAEKLTSEDSLMPLNRQLSRLGKRITIEGYELVYDNADNRWIFTHMLSDRYNLARGVYKESDGPQRHHKDFKKLNNNPNNLVRLTREDHFKRHQDVVRETMARPEVQAKIRAAHQDPKYRARISATMKSPAMQAMLSARAKKQWEDETYKQFMVGKFLEFYNSNPEYRQKNNALLNQLQKQHWSEEENRKAQAERTTRYFASHPEKRDEYSKNSKQQWQNESLLAWRSDTTKQQWTPEFRQKRKTAYNQTYLAKALQTLRKIYDATDSIDENQYQQVRKETNNKNLLRLDTILERFFGSNKEKLKTAVENFNHKIVRIEKVSERMDVYDLEVPETHNFALASGVFVHNSSKQGRNRRTQAILPLKGKILNVEKSRIDKMLASEEIRALVIAMGTAIADEFDITKLRYHKIVIMTDADVDGAHIRTLLLTLFYRYFFKLIEAGHIYIAQPPLYRIQKGKDLQYAYSDAEKDKIGTTGASVQRYKGLGEMNPDQLWETTMNPENRVLLQVTVADAEAADDIFDVLMGQEVLPRKKFIQTHAKNVKNLDI